MNTISLLPLLLLSFIASIAIGHETTVTVTEAIATMTVTEFLLPTSHYQSVPKAGPLHTCFQTVSAPKNWFAVAWGSGAFLDSAQCDKLRKAIEKQGGKEISDWRCFWYYDSRTGKGVTKTEGEFKRSAGKMVNVIETAVGKIWGREAVEQCRSF